MGYPSFPNALSGLFSILALNLSLLKVSTEGLLFPILRMLGWGGARTTTRDELESANRMPPFAEAIRESLPVVPFDPLLHSKAEPEAGDDEQSMAQQQQCAVCLSELECGQVICELPSCDHAFHKACLDKWLDHRQTTCPLCRSSLASPELTGRYRLREQQLAQELMLWFSSFHGAGVHGTGIHGFWWQS